MAQVCANCGSGSTQTLADCYQCLECGTRSQDRNTPVEGPGPDGGEELQVKLP